MEEKYKRLNNEYLQLLNVVDEHSIWVVADLEGKVIEANPRYCERSGFGKSEIINSTHMFVNPDIHEDIFHDDLWRKIRSGNIWKGDICNLTKAGQKYWVRATILPVKGISGDIEKYISIRTEISQLDEKQVGLAKLFDLEELNSRLEIDKLALSSKNTTLENAVAQSYREKRQSKLIIKQNIETMVLPLVRQLKQKMIGMDKKFVELVETSLHDVCENILPKQRDFVKVLTPKEIQICGMIKNGLSVKEIAQFF